MEEDYFTEIQHNQEQQGSPPPQYGNTQEYNLNGPTDLSDNAPINIEYSYNPPAQDAPPAEDNENEFDQFAEDQITRRIRQQQEKVQLQLRQKSQKEWEEKSKRKEEGHKQLEQYLLLKEKEKEERASENTRKEAQCRENWSKLNEQAGWRKVITSINLKQGERKGPKDINRMREAILSRRQ